MKIIGISGNATVGKDSFCNALIGLLKEHDIKAKRYAFADELKYEADEFLKSSLGISAFTTDKKEKKLIRPFLVWWGTDFRRDLDDSHWINKVNEKLIDEGVVYIITDVRYQNEFGWLKNNGGLSLFLDRAISGVGLDGLPNTVQPGNDYEKENNKWLKAQADINTTWQTIKDPAYRKKFILRNVFPEILSYIEGEDS
jgi:hypothetical protein